MRNAAVKSKEGTKRQDTKRHETKRQPSLNNVCETFFLADVAAGLNCSVDVEPSDVRFHRCALSLWAVNLFVGAEVSCWVMLL